MRSVSRTLWSVNKDTRFPLSFSEKMIFLDFLTAIVSMPGTARRAGMNWWRDDQGARMLRTPTLAAETVLAAAWAAASVSSPREASLAARAGSRHRAQSFSRNREQFAHTVAPKIDGSSAVADGPCAARCTWESSVTSEPIRLEPCPSPRGRRRSGRKRGPFFRRRLGPRSPTISPTRRPG